MKGKLEPAERQRLIEEGISRGYYVFMLCINHFPDFEFFLDHFYLCL
jgi:hypothetical protein